VERCQCPQKSARADKGLEKNAVVWCGEREKRSVARKWGGCEVGGGKRDGGVRE